MHSTVTIQISPESQPSIPSWLGEVAAFAHVFTHTGMLTTIQEPVRFARACFGNDDLIDFVMVLIGYTLSGEATLKAFYERLAPWASPFMALGWRAANCPIVPPCLGFWQPLISLLWKPCERFFKRICLHGSHFLPPLGLFDRTGVQWLVVDVDGTRQAARQRALPQTDALPAPYRRAGAGLRTRLDFPQARGGGSDEDCDSPGPYPSATRDVWEYRQRRLPGRTKARDRGNHTLCNPARACSHLSSRAVGWLVWRCCAPARCARGTAFSDREESGLPSARP